MKRWTRQFQQGRETIEDDDHPGPSCTVMTTIFWNVEGIILVDYLPRNTTMTVFYYAELICRVREALKAKRRGKIDSIPPKMQNVPFETLDSKK